MSITRSFLGAALLSAALAGAMPPPEGALLATKIARYVPTEVTADVSRLSPGDARALVKILAASKLMDELFLLQVWHGNHALRSRLQQDRSALGRLRLHLFQINVCPWSRLDRNQPFVPGVPEVKPPGGAFYPEDLTKAEFEAWLKTLSEAERAAATGYFHVIRRGKPDGGLKAVPYSEEYRDLLKPAARLLREAALLTDNVSLKRYLIARAEAFFSNDYYESDVRWMELDSPIELTIGPYETYEDELFGYKAAWEAYVTIRDDAETARVSAYASRMQELEDHLPLAPNHRNPKVGALAPIRVVDELFASGDGNRGYQCSAFNLPNDERVVREKGAKRVMLRNVQQVKFSKLQVPIANRVMAPAQRSLVTFEAFFAAILAHELAHGLGPQEIVVGGRKTTPRLELQDLYSGFEELKADLTGLWIVDYLGRQGVVEREVVDTLYTTYLAELFRMVRFGLGEAHAQCAAFAFNWLSDEGAFVADERAGTFAVDETKVRAAVERFAGLLLTVEAEGDRARAKELLDRYVVVRPVMQRAVDRLNDIPVDIEARYPLAR